MASVLIVQFMLRLLVVTLVTLTYCFSLKSVASFLSVKQRSHSHSHSNTRLTTLSSRRMSLSSVSTAESPHNNNNNNNNNSKMPALPIPPMLLSTTPGTWAYDTMSRRVDAEILQRTYDENVEVFTRPDFASILHNFQALRNELQNAATTPMRYLNKSTATTTNDDDDNEELSQWQDIIKPHVDNNDTWLSTPWLIAEFYLYRRLLECTGYFDPLSVGYKFDPFETQKRSGLLASIASAESVLHKIQQTVAATTTTATTTATATATATTEKDGLALAVELALWGNKMDLSLWPADVIATASNGNNNNNNNNNAISFAKVLEKAKENLLHDDTHQLSALFESLKIKGGGNIDIIVDNAGFELVTDLALADFLITQGIAKCITFQLKSHPTFVSDAMEKDLRQTVEYFATDLVNDDSKYQYCQEAGKRWMTFLQEDKWKCNQDKFWVQGIAMWEMERVARPLFMDLNTRCDLAFVKGDANYRRLVGDCSWDYTTPFQQIVGAYFPCAVCALRTLKSEVACGIDATQVKRASSLDDQWLVNGRFGVIHFGTGAGQSSE